MNLIANSGALCLTGRVQSLIEEPGDLKISQVEIKLSHCKINTVAKK
jgi:hypothetical protein